MASSGACATRLASFTRVTGPSTGNSRVDEGEDGKWRTAGDSAHLCAWLFPAERLLRLLTGRGLSTRPAGHPTTG
jgi:hypothetical protein